MIIYDNDSISRDIINEYNKTKSKNISAGRISVLSIHSDHTLIVSEDQTADIVVLSLDIGSDKTGLTYFHHQPPTPEEVEYAINTVEDELMLAFKKLPPDTELFSKDLQIRQIADLAGLSGSDEIIFSRSSIEDFFTRFAALSMGRPVKTDSIPVNTSFSATLLILREIMHHLKFEKITLIK